jgi:two-component system, sensor histidine kinase
LAPSDAAALLLRPGTGTVNAGTTAQDIRRQLTELALQQAMAAGRVGMAGACLVAALVSPGLGYGAAAGWAALLCAYLLWRDRLLNRTLAALDRAPGADAWLPLIGSTVGLGSLLGLFGATTVLDVAHEYRLLLTMVLCCWCAAAMASLGFSARLYAAYLAAVLGPLALAWVFTDAPGRLPIAASLVLFGLVLQVFSLNFARRVQEGIAIRAENAELVRQLAAANEAKTRFLLAASHDLRQPLHAIGLMGAGLLRLQDPQEIRDLCRTLAATVQNLNALFSSILDVSRLDSGDVRIALLDVPLDRLLSQLDSEYRALCLAQGRRWECQVEQAAVRTDPAQLERLLRNLLDNALKHGGDGAVRLAVARAGTQVQLTVADTGPGIPPPERARVFDEFYRMGNSASGLGLGLSIVRRLADRLGARLELGWTDPQQRRGACFTLSLPAVEGGAAAPMLEEEPVDLAGLRILLLDDQEEVLAAAQALLRSWGCQVAACRSALDLAPALAELGEPDVALVDYQLANGESGVAAIAGVQERFPGMGTLVVTGESDPARIAALQDVGLVLRKPLAPEALQRALAGIRRA